jgi:hypothetical protein
VGAVDSEAVRLPPLKQIEHEAIPQWAEGIHYNKGIFNEELVYFDDEADYFECRGDDSSIVRYTFEMIETPNTLPTRPTFIASALPRSRAARTAAELVPIAGYYGCLVRAQ